MNNENNSRILVVDDEPANIFLLNGLLTETGYSVTTATNGKDAIQLMQQEVFDLVLLDIMMPEITGIDILKYMVHDSNLKEIPVIMVSAKSEAEDVEEALSLGAVEYIKKPINDIELIARVKTVLRIKKQEDELKFLLKSKEEFINIVSHDVRTPFSAITGFAELLLTDMKANQEFSKRHQEYLNFIIETSNYMFDYFNKLLSWANLGGREIQLKRGNIKLLSLLHASVVIFKSKLDNKKQKLYVECNEDFTVNVDSTYFSQVINNLLSNAIKFTPIEGSITISCEDMNGKHCILIKDTGTGMPELSKQEFFDQSFHKSARGTNGEKGTGIGLLICKRILDAHGFGLDYNSVPRKGTTFIITT